MNSPSPAPIKVAIVEDDRGIRESLAILINGAGGFSCTTVFGNAESALAQLPKDWPDVVLMDINLPEMSGIECVAKLKALRPTLQVLMLTVYMDGDKIFRSLKAGASGYLIKQTPPSEILAAIDEVRRGGAPMSTVVARKVVDYFQAQAAAPDPDVLTPREREILAHLSKGYQDKEIAELLGLSVLTVRTHVRNIYEKLHVRSRTEAVVKFLGK